MTEKQKMKIWKYASQTNYKSECFRDDYTDFSAHLKMAGSIENYL